MKLFTVSFFGHRIVPEFREAEERVEALIHTLLLENEYVEFLVGRNGDFDQIVTSAVKRQQRCVSGGTAGGYSRRSLWLPPAGSYDDAGLIPVTCGQKVIRPNRRVDHVQVGRCRGHAVCPHAG